MTLNRNPLLTTYFWVCKCDKDNINMKSRLGCRICKCTQEESPNSHILDATTYILKAIARGVLIRIDANDRACFDGLIKDIDELKEELRDNLYRDHEIYMEYPNG